MAVDRFYPRQTDYITELNKLAGEVADLGAGVAGPTLRSATLVTLAGVTLYTLPFAVAGWPAQQPILTVGGIRTVNFSLPTATSIDITETVFAGEEVHITALAL